MERADNNPFAYAPCEGVTHIRVLVERLKQVRTALHASLLAERSRSAALEERLSRAVQAEQVATEAAKKALVGAKDYALLDRLARHLREENRVLKLEVQEARNMAAVEAEVAAARLAAWERQAKESQRALDQEKQRARDRAAEAREAADRDKRALQESFRKQAEDARRESEEALAALRRELQDMRNQCAEEVNVVSLEGAERAAQLMDRVESLEADNRALAEQLYASSDHIRHLESRQAELRIVHEAERNRLLESNRSLMLQQQNMMAVPARAAPRQRGGGGPRGRAATAGPRGPRFQTPVGVHAPGPQSYPQLPMAWRVRGVATLQQGQHGEHGDPAAPSPAGRVALQTRTPQPRDTASTSSTRDAHEHEQCRVRRNLFAEEVGLSQQPPPAPISEDPREDSRMTSRRATTQGGPQPSAPSLFSFKRSVFGASTMRSAPHVRDKAGLAETPTPRTVTESHDVDLQGAAPASDNDVIAVATQGAEQRKRPRTAREEAPPADGPALAGHAGHAGHAPTRTSRAVEPKLPPPSAPSAPVGPGPSLDKPKVIPDSFLYYLSKLRVPNPVIAPPTQQQQPPHAPQPPQPARPPPPRSEPAAPADRESTRRFFQARASQGASAPSAPAPRHEEGPPSPKQPEVPPAPPERQDPRDAGSTAGRPVSEGPAVASDDGDVALQETQELVVPQGSSSDTDLSDAVSIPTGLSLSTVGGSLMSVVTFEEQDRPPSVEPRGNLAEEEATMVSDIADAAVAQAPASPPTLATVPAEAGSAIGRPSPPGTEAAPPAPAAVAPKTPGLQESAVADETTRALLEADTVAAGSSPARRYGDVHAVTPPRATEAVTLTCGPPDSAEPPARAPQRGQRSLQPVTSSPPPTPQRSEAAEGQRQEAASVVQGSGAAAADGDDQPSRPAQGDAALVSASGTTASPGRQESISYSPLSEPGSEPGREQADVAGPSPFSEVRVQDKRLAGEEPVDRGEPTQPVEAEGGVEAPQSPRPTTGLALLQESYIVGCTQGAGVSSRGTTPGPCSSSASLHTPASLQSATRGSPMQSLQDTLCSAKRPAPSSPPGPGPGPSEDHVDAMSTTPRRTAKTLSKKKRRLLLLERDD